MDSDCRGLDYRPRGPAPPSSVRRRSCRSRKPASSSANRGSSGSNAIAASNAASTSLPGARSQSRVRARSRDAQARRAGRGVHLNYPFEQSPGLDKQAPVDILPRLPLLLIGVPGEPHLGLGKFVEGAGVGEHRLSGLQEIPVCRLRVAEAARQNGRIDGVLAGDDFRQTVEQAPGVLLPAARQKRFDQDIGHVGVGDPGDLVP